MFCNQLFPASSDVIDSEVVGNCFRSRGNYDEAISWHENARQFHLKQDCLPDRDDDVAISSLKFGFHVNPVVL